MSTIVTRTGKGAPLTWAEADANFTNLNTDKLEAGFPASAVANTPAGGIGATDVQTALNELDTEKVAYTRIDDSDGSSLVGFLQAGTGTVSRTVQSKLRDVVSVKDFGVVGDGVADDTAGIQAAIDSLSYGEVHIPNGTFRLTATLDMKSNVTVRCASNTIIDCEDIVSGDAVLFLGTIGSEVAFTESRTRGDTTIKLTSSPFVVGDIVHLVSYVSVFDAGEYNLGYNPSDNCYYSEWNIIAEDLGSNVYRLAVPFEFPNWTTAAKAKKVTPCSNSHWIGGTFNRTTSGAASDSIFASSFAYGCTVRDVVTNRAARPGWSVEWMESWKCEAKDITNSNDPGFLYNYFVNHAEFNRFKTVGSQDCGFVGLQESFGGQSVDFTYSSSQAPYSNIRSYCHDSFFHRCFEGLTSHPGCYKDRWLNNTITDCYDDGMVLRGYMPVVRGNIIESTVDITDDLVFTAGTFVIGRQYKVTTVGTTDFTLVGASANTVGVDFIATGVGTGTGTATQADTYGIRLGYGGARRADISNNTIRGFYGAFGIYGSPALGEWTNVLANIHDNEVSSCFVGLTTASIGENNSVRFITYQNNRHSSIGRFVVQFPEYLAGCTIKGNVLDGGFRYTGGGSYVAFVEAAANCPALNISGNVWNRTKESNSGYTKYFVRIEAITDLTAFPAVDWAAQTYVNDNAASWDTDASFTYYSIARGDNYYQFSTLIPELYTSAISAGVALAIPSPHRVFYLNVDTEASAAIDDLDVLNPYFNCYFKEGDVVYIRTATNARDVVIRDIATSGAALNGFQTPGGASITLGTANDIVTCLYQGTAWAVAAQSING